MKEHEQSLPLLENEDLNSSGPRENRYSSLLSRARQAKLVLALGLYSLLMTAIVLLQNLPHAKTTVPYCKMHMLREKKILVNEPQAPARHLLQFEEQKANPDEHSIFSDSPSSEVDKAWDDLVRRRISCFLFFTLKG